MLSQEKEHELFTKLRNDVWYLVAEEGGSAAINICIAQLCAHCDEQRTEIESLQKEIELGMTQLAEKDAQISTYRENGVSIHKAVDAATKHLQEENESLRGQLTMRHLEIDAEIARLQSLCVEAYPHLASSCFEVPVDLPDRLKAAANGET